MRARHIESNGGNKSHHVFAQSAAYKLHNVLPDALHLGTMKIGEERKGQFSIKNGSIVPYPVRLSWGSFGDGGAEEEAGRTAEVSIEEGGFDEQLIASRRAQSEPATLSDGGFQISHGSLELAPYEKGPGNVEAKWSQVIEVNFAFPGIPLSVLDTGRLGGGEDGDGDSDDDDVKEVNEVFDLDDSASLSALASYSNLKVSLDRSEKA